MIGAKHIDKGQSLTLIEHIFLVEEWNRNQKNNNKNLDKEKYNNNNKRKGICELYIFIFLLNFYLLLVYDYYIYTGQNARFIKDLLSFWFYFQTFLCYLMVFFFYMTLVPVLWNMKINLCSFYWSCIEFIV